MPFRARGKVVQVKRGGKWTTFRTAATHAKAKAQATAINMRYAGVSKRKKKTHRRRKKR